MIRTIRAVDFLRARLCLIDAFFRLAFHRCSLSFRSRFASCATFYTLSRFFRRFFKSSLSLRPLLVFVVSFYKLSLSSSLSISLQHAPLSLHLYPAFTRTFSSPLFHPIHPRSSTFSISHRLASTIMDPSLFLLSVIVLFLLVSAASVSLQYHSSRHVLFLQPCSLSSSIILPELYPSHSLSFSPSYLPPTHMHPPPSSSAGSVRIGPAR